MRTPLLLVALAIVLSPGASGQRLYWGVIGGTGLTPDYPHYDVSAPADGYGNPAYHFERVSGPRSFILGGLLEVQATRNLSVEANILYRPLRIRQMFTTFPATGPAQTSNMKYVSWNTWEFPVLLKWSLPTAFGSSRVRPFVEGGPSFRTSQDGSGFPPSQFGMTAGAGVAFHLGKIRLAPTLRYTRWNHETAFYPTKRDQLEFLTSVAWGTGVDPLHLTGHRVSLGLLGGVSGIGQFYFPQSGVRKSAGYLAGVSVQVELRQNLALEAAAIYKPLRVGFDPGNFYSVLTWDFPILLKYHLTKLGRAPFVEAGPSFRAAGNLNGYNPSHFGGTFGFGLETRKGKARLSTMLRYTRWAKDARPTFYYQFNQPNDYARTNQNALELLLGIGF